MLDNTILSSFTQTYLVTGGYRGSPLASTEILPKDASQWVYSGNLPSARHGLRGATLGDKLIMTGDIIVMLMRTYLSLFTIARWWR